MKLKATSLFLGLCLAILAVAASPAHAVGPHRSTTAFSAFHVEINTLTNYPGDPYLCLFENNGAVVNTCTYTVGLEFDLPIDTYDKKAIKVQNGWDAIYDQAGESCQAFAYTGSMPSSNVGTNVSFTGPGQTKTTTVSLPAGYTSIQVLCTVPPGDAISNLIWNP